MFRKSFIFINEEDIISMSILEAYCHGKPFWWQLFFGWRGTKHGTMEYIVEQKDAKILLDSCKYTKEKVMDIPAQIKTFNKMLSEGRDSK